MLRVADSIERIYETNRPIALKLPPTGKCLQNIECTSGTVCCMDQLELVRAGPAAPGEANSAAEREKTEAFNLKKMADYKSLSKSLMDVALLTANADQLRFTLAKVKYLKIQLESLYHPSPAWYILFLTNRLQ